MKGINWNYSFFFGWIGVTIHVFWNCQKASAYVLVYFYYKNLCQNKNERKQLKEVVCVFFFFKQYASCLSYTSSAEREVMMLVLFMCWLSRNNMHAIRVFVISFFSCCAAILNPKLNNNSFPIFGIFIHFFHSIHGISSLTPLNKNTVVTYIFSSVLLHRYRCDGEMFSTFILKL